MYNDKLTQSIAEAVKKCMDEELKGQQHKLDVNKNNKIDAEDLKHLRAGKKPVEEAMQKSDVPAYLRKQQGEKPLTVADVKAPRKDSISASANLAKARNEEVEQIEEADIEKTSTGMRVYGSSYGNSVRARREQVKKSVDTAKGPKMKDLEAIEGEKKKKKFSEMVETYVESGIKGLFESIIKEEPTSDEFKSELEKQKAKAEGKAPQADVAKAAVQAVQQEEETVEIKLVINGENGYAEAFLDEGTMTGITLGAKVKNKQGGYNQDVHHNGKKIGHIEAYKHRTGMRYGSHHDASGDATAGNRDAEESIADIRYSHAQHLRDLKKEEVEQLDELSPGTLKSYIKSAKANKKFEADTQNTAMRKNDHMMASDSAEKVAKRKEGIKTAKAKLNAEEVEQIDELSLDTLKSAAQKNADKAYEYHMDDNKHWARKSAQRALSLKAKIAQKERQMKANEEVEQVEERSLSEPEMKKREEVVKSMKKGIQGFKDRYGDRAKEVMYATATKIAKKD